MGRRVRERQSSGTSMNVHADWPSFEGLGRHPALETLAVGPPDGGDDRRLPRRAGVSAGRAGGADLRLARRGGACASGALDPWRRQPAAVRAARRDRPLAAAAAGRGRRAVRVQARDRARRARGAGARSAEPGAGGRSVRGELGRAGRSATSGRSGACRAGRRRGGSRRSGSRAAAFGETRGVRVYLPAGHDPARAYPLVVVHDGDDFVSYADLPVVLDNLIDAGEIPPVIAALVQTRDRLGEYSGSRAHARFLVQELLPALGARWRIAEAPSERVLLGASLGAVASLVDRLPLSRGVRRAGAEVGVVHPRRAEARAPAASGVPPHRAADAGAPARAGAAGDAGLRLDRRARGARRREPGARELLARTRRRCSVQERVGRPPLAQLARPAARRADLGAAARRRKRPADGRAPAPGGRGDGTWRSASSTSGCRSGPTSAGRSPTRACSRRSTST